MLWPKITQHPYYAMNSLLCCGTEVRHRSFSWSCRFTVNPKRRIRQHNGEIGAGAWKTKRHVPLVYFIPQAPMLLMTVNIEKYSLVGFKRQHSIHEEPSAGAGPGTWCW